MKVKTVFLGKKLREVMNTFLNIKQVFTVFLYSFCLTTFCVILSSKLEIKDNILNLATNVKQETHFDFDIADIKNIYPVFNDASYQVDQPVKEGHSIPEVNLASDIEKIDSISKEAAQSVFASNKLSISITEGSPQRISIQDMRILNYSTLKNIDYQACFDKVVTLTKKSDPILLYNTHTSESYAPSEKYQFVHEGTYRSRDARYNMLSVAKELEKNLKEKNITVVQDTTPHDYGTYTSAYARSKITVQNDLKKYGSFGISIDVHRDAGGTLDFAPKTQINGVTVASCMLVMGVGTSKSRNPYYEDNLALALKMQMLADKIYPGLFRPMYIRDSVYNQDLNKFSLLIEVGATGNTLEEAYLATRCISNLFDLIYKN